jgi:hypothetical protein
MHTVLHGLVVCACHWGSGPSKKRKMAKRKKGADECEVGGLGLALRPGSCGPRKGA